MSYPFKLPSVENHLLTITNPNPSLWIIELHNGQDNRLTHVLVRDGLMPALNFVEKEWRERWRAAHAANDDRGGQGALIIVGRTDQDKFFSNGLDFSSIRDDDSFFPDIFNPFLARLLEFPIPTVAAINGHCFAAGFILAMTCDYRIVRDSSKRNIWLCMNEVHFGAVWPLSFAAVLRAKWGDLRLHRKIALEGYRFTPAEALDAGIVDYVVAGGTREVMAKAEEVAMTKAAFAKGGVWGLIKRDVYSDVLEFIRKYWKKTNPFIEDAEAKARLAKL